MSYKTIIVDRSYQKLAHIKLNLPQTRNALSAEMIDELTDCAQALHDDEAVRVVALSGLGKTFCAGGDLRWMQAQMNADAKTRRDAARALAGMLQTLNELPKPLIGYVHGAAMGGGVGLASVCDVVLADPGTKFGLTETRLGLIPATIGPYVIGRLGAAKARSLFYAARLFDAQEAMQVGLVNRVVPLSQMTEAIADEYAPYEATGPYAVAQAKALLHRLGTPISQASIEASIDALVKVWEGPEAQAGIAAFFDKRPPPWQE